MKGFHAVRTLATVHARQLASYVDSKVCVEDSLVETQPSSRVWHLCNGAHVLDQGKVFKGLVRVHVPTLDIGREDWARSSWQWRLLLCFAKSGLVYLFRHVPPSERTSMEAWYPEASR